MHRPPPVLDRREWLTRSSRAACGLLVGSPAASSSPPLIVGPDGETDWRDHRIVVRTVNHPHVGLDACRVCTHIWNTEEQVDLLLGVLKDKLARTSSGV